MQLISNHVDLVSSHFVFLNSWAMKYMFAILLFAGCWALSSGFWLWNLQDESQLVVVRKCKRVIRYFYWLAEIISKNLDKSWDVLFSDNEQCQWFNSGIMGVIPRTFNRTTLCRCKFIGVYECSTLTIHKSHQNDSNSFPSSHFRKFKGKFGSERNKKH